MVEKSFSSLDPEGIKLANSVMNLLLFTTISTEITGPLATKFVLTKAGEISVK